MQNTKIKVIGVIRDEHNTSTTTNAAAANLKLASLLHCRRRWEWTREWMRKNENQFTSSENLTKDLHFRSQEMYHLNCFLHITEPQFVYLVKLLGPIITKHGPQRKKKFFSAEERLAITLKYLATGEFHSCRHYCFRASKTVILKMISDICLNIYEALKDQFISTPKTESDWCKVSTEFLRKTNIPNCLGSMTMEHMVFSKPGSKHRFVYDPNDTTVLTAIVDANDNFIYVDVGQKSFEKDESVFEKSAIKAAIEQNTLNLPKPTQLDMKYYFVGKRKLPLKPYLMKTFNPYPNAAVSSHAYGTKEYEFCSAIESVEIKSKHAFRMLTNVFPVLSLPLSTDGESARNVVLACVTLYNFLRKTDQKFLDKSEELKTKDEESIHSVEKKPVDEYEAVPCIFLSDCFKSVTNQLGDDDNAETERNRLTNYVFARRHNESLNFV